MKNMGIHRGVNNGFFNFSFLFYSMPFVIKYEKLIIGNVLASLYLQNIKPKVHYTTDYWMFVF